MAKVTKATIKSFIKKNEGKLYIRTTTSFDGMTDGIETCADRGWTLAQAPDAGQNHSNRLGIQGAWFVGHSADYFKPINVDGFVGFNVYNCCGEFDLAIKQ